MKVLYPKKLAFLLLLAGTLATSQLMAQGGPPSSGGPNPCFPPATPCVPIDNGIGFLIVAGLLYGGKMAYDLQRKSRQSERK